MIFGLGVLLWSVALLVVGRLVFIGREPSGRGWIWLLLGLALASALLFRPHEDIFGGEDPGSYINSGLSYARQGQFFYVDPLLQAVSEEVRPAFYYGDETFGTTKDACLWVRDARRALIGPHFQPAYPLLIAAFSRVTGSVGALYIIPLFTLFMALALRAWARQLLPHSLAGRIAPLLFILHPLTLWHGRCARPEMIAAFMFFGGSALLIHAWNQRRWKQWWDIILGAMALGLAPLFHVTASFLVIPAGLLVIIIILRGRDDFLLFLLAALLGLLLLVWQTIWVTDYYNLRYLLCFPIFHPWPTSGFLGVGFALLLLLCLYRRRRLAQRGPPESAAAPSIAPLWGLALGLVALLFIFWIARVRAPDGSLNFVGPLFANCFWVTDFRAFINMVSSPLAALALLGFLAWLTGPSWRRPERIVLALLVFPALIFSGNIQDFMMTRYWLIALIPMTVLGLTALLTIFPDRRRGAWLALAAALLVAGLGLQQRTHLVAVTDYKGLARFLRPFAERIISEDGILLCEYSRLAAPFEHFFGIPTLGLDNERQDDYTAAELAWQEIMRQDPQRAAFFITPFHQPVSDLFSFELLHKDCYQGAKLLQARRSLPTRIGTHRLPLRLYRMQLTPESAGLAPTGLQYDQLDAGNMGLRGFANIRRETAAFDSWYSALSLAVLAPLPDLVSARLSLSMQNAPYLALKQLLVSAPDELAAPTQPGSTGFMARWARARAQILVPPELGAGYLVLLLKTPRLPTAETMQVRLSWGAADLMQWQPPVDKWQWLVVPLPAAASGQWLSLACEPAWDPQLSGYPADLGVLIGMISFWPAAEL